MIKDPRKIGIVTQDNIVWEEFSLEENLLIIGRFCGIKEAELITKIQSLYDDLTIGHLKDVLAKHLSGGSKRKLCIAMALIYEP